MTAKIMSGGVCRYKQPHTNSAQLLMMYACIGATCTQAWQGVLLSAEGNSLRSAVSFCLWHALLYVTAIKVVLPDGDMRKLRVHVVIFSSGPRYNFGIKKK